MSASSTDPARRRFIRLLAASAVAAPVAGLAGTGEARAAELPKLDPESERARQFSYTHDAAATEDPGRKPGARCANCTHFRGDADTTWAPCNIFPEHRVNAGGWCSSWFSAA